jgi:hypothetical protein
VGKPVILANDVVATAEERLAAGNIAQPPLNDRRNGFAWPDTPLGVVKRGGSYLFFASDGAMHYKQLWEGAAYGNNKAGSACGTLGTLDHPLGDGPPVDVTIRPNPHFFTNFNYARYDYIGGGPVYQVPEGMTGAGNLILVYHAELATPVTRSFYSVLGLAASTDGGATWVDLGEIVRVNQPYRPTLEGFEIGDPPLVLSPDGNYFYIYFQDWQANGTRSPSGSVTQVSVARASVAEVLAAAFGPGNPHAALFYKYYQGGWTQPGVGGKSTDLNPQAFVSGESQVAWSAALGRYVMIVSDGVVLGYAESPDGLNWTKPTLLWDFRHDPDQPRVYVMPVGEGDDPGVLGPEFYIFYTRYPNDGTGWAGATVGRFRVGD